MKVLVGVGGGPDAYRALDAALERAREAGDDLTVAVIENEEAPDDIDEVAATAEERVAAAAVPADVVRLSGHPGSELVDFAEREGYDRIVIGGGQTSPMGKINLGSVTEFVLLNSHISVTLVR